MLFIFRSKSHVNNFNVLWAMHCLNPRWKRCTIHFAYIFIKMQSICCYLLTTSHNVISSFADVEQRGKAV